MSQNGGCHLQPYYLFHRICDCYPSITRRAAPKVTSPRTLKLTNLDLILHLGRNHPRGTHFPGSQIHLNRNLHRCSYQNLPRRYFENSVLNYTNQYQSTVCHHVGHWRNLSDSIRMILHLWVAKHRFWLLFQLKNLRIVKDYNPMMLLIKTETSMDPCQVKDGYLG
jgi:hypothetical protein